ncbi:MAG: TetR/AcrR family transcriptional regulator [Saprospiraceae bacterium]|nr:TetR/AcrR family transcriptional regulator [Saprospiraceae bacterium]
MGQQAHEGDRLIHIRHSAMQLFKERGYAATTMRDLANKVGIEAASLYNHIDSKQSILSSICFEMSRHYSTGLSDMVESDEAAIQRLKAMVVRHIDIILQFTDEAAVAEREWRHLQEPAYSDYRRSRQIYEKTIESLIEQAMINGELRKAHSKIILYTLLASVQWIQMWYHKGRSISKETLREDIVSILFDGVTSN